MSYVTRLWVVSLAEVRGAIGSRDQELLGVLRAHPEIAHTDRYSGDAPSLAVIVGQLINGSTLDERLGFLYGYALELLCEHFGKRLDFEVGFIQDLELPTRLNADHRLPVRLPKPDDFPSINYLTNEELADELAKLEPLVAHTRDKQLQEYQEDFVSCLRGVRESGRDLVTFTS